MSSHPFQPCGAPTLVLVSVPIAPGPHHGGSQPSPVGVSPSQNSGTLRVAASLPRMGRLGSLQTPPPKPHLHSTPPHLPSVRRKAQGPSAGLPEGPFPPVLGGPEQRKPSSQQREMDPLPSLGMGQLVGQVSGPSSCPWGSVHLIQRSLTLSVPHLPNLNSPHSPTRRAHTDTTHITHTHHTHHTPHTSHPHTHPEMQALSTAMGERGRGQGAGSLAP